MEEVEYIIIYEEPVKEVEQRANFKSDELNIAVAHLKDRKKNAAEHGLSSDGYKLMEIRRGTPVIVDEVTATPIEPVEIDPTTQVAVRE